MSEAQRSYPIWMLHEDGKPDVEIAKEFDAERDALVNQIKAAFPTVPIVRHDKVAIQPNGYSESFGDMDGINRDFGGKSWQEISLETLAQYSDHLKVFTHEGFHYYLPAMITAVINRFSDMEFLPDRLPEVFSKTFYSYYPFDRKAHKYTREQAKIILEFLQFLEKWFTIGTYEEHIRCTVFELKSSIEYWQTELDKMHAQ